MAYVPVPKDLSRVKTKVALNLTKRQLICFSLAALAGLPVYFLTKSQIGTDVAATIMVIIMLPFFFFAMYEKDGFSAEQIVFHIIRQKMLRPGIRPYQTENMYDRLVEQRKLEQEGMLLEQKEKAAKKTISQYICSVFQVRQPEGKADRKKTGAKGQNKGRTRSKKRSK